MELLQRDIVSHIHINDLNSGVYSFWYSLLHDTEALMGKIYDCKLDMPTWYEQRSIMENYADYDVLDIGFAFFFLNRTNRSGIISAGVIGGYEQTGNYKIDARFNKDELISRITSIAKRKSQISVYNLDAEKFLSDLDSQAIESGFAYIDPPYYVKGKRLYDNFYEFEDHFRIGQLISSLKMPWVLSYDDHDEIRKIYSRFRMAELDLVYSAASKVKGQEVIFFSRNISIPDELGAA